MPEARGEDDDNNQQSPVPALPPLDIADDFSFHGALWVLSQKDSISYTELELLVDLFGAETLAAIEPIHEARGDTCFWQRCRELAATIVLEERMTRLEIIRTILRVALADDELGPSENDAVLDLAELIGLVADDLAVLAAEYSDPEFVDYQFQPGQQVQVQLDGEWLMGTVQSVEAAGDLRILFAENGETLCLSPTADLIRPVLDKRAG